MARLAIEEVIVGGRRARRITADDVEVAPALLRRRDRRQPLEVRPRRVVQSNLRLPCAHPGHRSREVHDRIRFERHRTMSGDATRGQLDGTGDLLERLYRREFDLAIGARHVAAFRRQYSASTCGKY